MCMAGHIMVTQKCLLNKPIIPKRPVTLYWNYFCKCYYLTLPPHSDSPELCICLYDTHVVRRHSWTIKEKDKAEPGRIHVFPYVKGHRVPAFFPQPRKCSNMCTMLLPRKAHEKLSTQGFYRGWSWRHSLPSRYQNSTTSSKGKQLFSINQTVQSQQSKPPYNSENA